MVRRQRRRMSRYEELRNQLTIAMVQCHEAKLGEAHDTEFYVDHILSIIADKLKEEHKAGIKKGLARHENPLDAPCIFCGYKGEGYWQKGTHLPDCPFVDIGGEADRQSKLKEWK